MSHSLYFMDNFGKTIFNARKKYPSMSLHKFKDKYRKEKPEIFISCVQIKTTTKYAMNLKTYSLDFKFVAHLVLIFI